MRRVSQEPIDEGILSKMYKNKIAVFIFFGAFMVILCFCVAWRQGMHIKSKEELKPKENILFFIGQGKCFVESYNEKLVFNKYSNSNINMDIQSIDRLVDTLSHYLNKEAKDAAMSIIDMEPVINDAQDGICVNNNELKSRIIEAIKKGCCTVEIPVTITYAKVDRQYLADNYGLLVSYSTPLNSSGANRTKNISIAADYVNGYVIMPGEIFSSNKAIGPRTESRGYKEAAVFVGNTVQQGLAGGICQLVTSLYNAAILCDYEVVERYNHAFAVAYERPGRDATISGDYLDFKFKNTGSYPICIKAYVKDNNVTVEIYGINERPDSRVEIVVKTLSSSPESLCTITYRRVYKENILEKEEILSMDEYIG